MAVEEKARTRLEATQFLELRRPGAVAVSPDGERVAFSVSTAYAEKGKRPESHIWTVESDGTCRQATGGSGTDSLPAWSADGTLAFASDRDHAGRMTVYLLGPGPGEARPVGDIDGSVERLSWSADGRRLLVLAADINFEGRGLTALGCDFGS